MGVYRSTYSTLTFLLIYISSSINLQIMMSLKQPKRFFRMVKAKEQDKNYSLMNYPEGLVHNIQC